MDDNKFSSYNQSKLKLNTFKDLYKALKTGVPPVDFLILGFLVWLEDFFIDVKIDIELDNAEKKYHEEIDKQELNWKEQAVITEEYTHSSGLPTLSISNPVIEKDETPRTIQD